MPPKNVTGSGKGNTIPLWTGRSTTSTLGNSLLSQSGSTVGSTVNVNATLTFPRNIFIGFQAASNLAAADNILIGNVGVMGDADTIRIGDHQASTFIAGIAGAVVLNGVPVLVNNSGKLGTITSSRRFKYDIKDMGGASSDLLKLRPVTFRHKQGQDTGSQPLQYGLIAEEVAHVYPELVVPDKSGEPQTVLYHVLPAMLLNEVQKQHREIEAMKKLIQSRQGLLKSRKSGSKSRNGNKSGNRS